MINHGGPSGPALPKGEDGGDGAPPSRKTGGGRTQPFRDILKLEGVGRAGFRCVGHSPTGAEAGAAGGVLNWRAWRRA